MDRTDQDWEEWGKTAPYYGVATDDKFRDPDAAALDDFFRTGEDHIAGVMAEIEGFAPGFVPSRALDFGCGTGRLLVPLSRMSPCVGIDVSPSMLVEARKNVDARGIGNRVELGRSDDRLSQVSGEFDLIHCYIVFQHIPVARGILIAGRLLGSLRAGGVAVLHFTYARNASWARKAWASARARVPALHAAANLLTGRSGAPMQMNCYDLPALLALFDGHACRIRSVSLSDHLGTLGAVFYLQRRA